MTEVVGILMVIVTVGVIGTLLDLPLNPARYRGRTYDPNRPIIRRAGAERIGMTGKVCYFCDAVTFGYSQYCGRCKRIGPDLSGVRRESTARLSLVESPPSSPLTAESSIVEVAATPRPTTSVPSSSRPARSEVTHGEVGAPTARRLS